MALMEENKNKKKQRERERAKNDDNKNVTLVIETAQKWRKKSNIKTENRDRNAK